MDITANRLEDADREAMRARVLETLREWDVGAVQHYGPGRRYEVTGSRVGGTRRANGSGRPAWLLATKGVP